MVCLIAAVPPFRKGRFQAHDILYTMSLDILYTPARA